MLFLMELGRKIGVKRLAADPEGLRAGAAVVEGAVFGLMGLLFAFTFSGAAARFETRRQLIIEEANNIGTAYLRLDLLPLESQPPLRDAFRSYVDTRLEVVRKIPDLVAAQDALARSISLQSEIWTKAVTACRGSQSATMLLLPAINQMIDITTTRLMAARTHPPLIIFVTLGALVFISSLLAGYGMAQGKTRSLLHTVGLALVIATTVYVIIDLEFPRLGFIHIDAFDQVFVDLRQSMK
jgi:hypothetical protein